MYKTCPYCGFSMSRAEEPHIGFNLSYVHETWWECPNCGYSEDGDYTDDDYNTEQYIDESDFEE